MTVQTSWDNITHNGAGSATEARHRLTTVLNDDPFVRMLSPEIRACMIDGFLLAMQAPRHVHEPDAISASTHTAVRRNTKQAITVMPLGFLTDGFKEHLTDLVAFALIPNPARDGHGRPM